MSITKNSGLHFADLLFYPSQFLNWCDFKALLRDRDRNGNPGVCLGKASVRGIEVKSPTRARGLSIGEGITQK